MSLTTQQVRDDWAAYECDRQRELAEITFLGRSPVRTIEKLVPFWAAAEQVLLAGGYGNASIVGSFNCRDISGSQRRSLHAFRLAVDIDPEQNARQGEGATMDWTKSKITQAQVDAVTAITTGNGVRVFRSGTVFSNPDPMHFEINCRQADIATGLAGVDLPKLDRVTDFVRASTLNVREQPSTSARKLGELGDGAPVERMPDARLTEAAGFEWVEVRGIIGAQIVEGWVADKFLEPAPKLERVTNVVSVQTVLRMRSQPNQSADIVAELPDGTPVDVADGSRVSAGGFEWVQARAVIRDRLATGFVAEQFLKPAT